MTLDIVLRTGAVFCVIMATKHYGVWGSADDAQDFYYTTINRARPYATLTCEYLNIRIPALPPQREKSFLGIYCYNQAVVTVVDILQICPTYIQYILEKIPGIMSEYAQRARENYENYQKQKAEEKERKRCIDDKLLVLPIEPHPNASCNCRRNYTDKK